MGLIYKIAPASLWRKAQETGSFEGAPADIADGFIHFSLRNQVEGAASRWFAGQDDLILVAADPAMLRDWLRYEPSRGGALFPHLYAPLPLTAIVWAKPILLRAGRHDFAGLLT